MSEIGSHNPDRFLIQGVWERKLCSIGVPSRFWRTEATKLSFKPVQVGNVKLSPTAQRHWVEVLMKDPPRHLPLVLVTSTPTDNGALYLAYFMLHHCLLNRRGAAVLDAACGQPPRSEQYPQVVVIHNILSTATSDRIQMVRDLVNRFPHSLRIVVVAAEPDPYRWCVTKLGKYPAMVFKHADIPGAA